MHPTNKRAESQAWVEGVHSEDRMPQYNFSNVASAEKADRTGGVGDDDLHDMEFNFEHIEKYPENIELDLDATDLSSYVLLDTRGAEFTESTVSGPTFSLGTPEDIDQHSGTEESLASRKLTSAQLTSQPNTKNDEAICSWVPIPPGYRGIVPAEHQAFISASPSVAKSYVSLDSSEWVVVSARATHIGRDTQGLGTVFPSSSSPVSYKTKLEFD